MVNWQKNLTRILKEKNLDMSAVSVKAGLDPSTVSAMLRRGTSPRVDTFLAIAGALGVTAEQLMSGTVPQETSAKLVPVAGQVAAGLWFDEGAWDTERYAPIYAVETRFKGVNQKAYKVVGDSMNAEGILDGSYVVTVPYWDVRAGFQDGDIVVVEQSDGGRIERTVKKITILANEYRLESRSTNPRWKDTAIVIPRTNPDPNDDRNVTLVGLVVGLFKDFAP